MQAAPLKVEKKNNNVAYTWKNTVVIKCGIFIPDTQVILSSGHCCFCDIKYSPETKKKTCHVFR